MNASARSPETVCLAIEAMRCRFEFVLSGPDPVGLRAAGEEAFQIVRSLERRLNVYAPASELSRLNRLAAAEHVRVSPELFRLLGLADKLSRQTAGAFDPTVGPLVCLWRETWRSGRLPGDEALAAARDCVGMSHIELDPRHRTVRFAREGVRLNLNALAKGYALDRAAEMLREAGVRSALLHAGSSSILAMGTPPDADAWRVGLADPFDSERVREIVELRDAALGISSQTLQQRPVEERAVGHVIHPLTAQPVGDDLLAAVVAPTAARADALSTALLGAPDTGPDWLREEETGLIICPKHPPRAMGYASEVLHPSA